MLFVVCVFVVCVGECLWLFGVCCLVFVARWLLCGCRVLFDDLSLIVCCCELLFVAVCSLLCVVYCVLFWCVVLLFVCSLLSCVVCCILLFVFCSFGVVCCLLLFVVVCCCLLCVVDRWLFFARCC